MSALRKISEFAQSIDVQITDQSMVNKQSLGAFERKPSEAANDHDAKTQQLVDALFIKLAAIFPAFERAAKTNSELAESKRQWLTAFIESRVNTVLQINRGLTKARASKTPFLPSVGQFIEWTKVDTKALGLPSADNALRDAYRYASDRALGVESRVSDFVKIIVKQVGFAVFNHSDSVERTREAFISVYETLAERLANGEDLQAEIPKALPTPAKATYMQTDEDKEAAKEALAKIRAMFK